MIFIFWIGLSILIGVYASNRGRNGVLYFFLSAILSPLLGFIFILAAGDDKKEIEKQRIASGQERKCPFCAELIKVEAKVCKHCGRDVDAIETDIANFGDLSEIDKWLISIGMSSYIPKFRAANIAYGDLDNIFQSTIEKITENTTDTRHIMKEILKRPNTIK